MNYKKTTQVPNELFDVHLKDLSHSEIKILLCIIRKTYGWKLKNGKRKTRDRISHSQFIQTTGISRRSLPKTIQTLILNQLIKVTDYNGLLLHTAESRKGKLGIFYAPLFQTYADTHNKVCKRKQLPGQIGLYNKTKRTKLKRQKGFARKSDWERMQELIQLKGDSGF